MGGQNRRSAARAISAEMAGYALSREAGDRDAAWAALERAHIVAQPYFLPHLRSHLHMAQFALALGDWRELTGQVVRLALVPLGSLTGRLPLGNTGRSRVSAFLPMPVPPDLAYLFMPGDK